MTGPKKNVYKDIKYTLFTKIKGGSQKERTYMFHNRLRDESMLYKNDNFT